jgi:hypothetical protein
MQHPDRQDPTLAALQRAAASDDTIEWEELPSMADSLRERLVMLGQHHDPRRRSGLGPAAASAWAETLPVDLDVLTALPVFHEPVRGLATREVHEPELFRHFFG